MSARKTDEAALLLRLMVAGAMLPHGIHKLTHGIEGIVRMVEAAGLPGVIAYGVHVGEVLAPLALIAGFHTRVAAAIFSFNMVVAVALAHADDVFALGRHGEWRVELQAMYALVPIAIILMGPGRYSLDARAGRG